MENIGFQTRDSIQVEAKQERDTIYHLFIEICMYQMVKYSMLFF